MKHSSKWRRLKRPVAGSRSHVRGLLRAGILDHDEVTALLAARDDVAAELTVGTFDVLASNEDSHTPDTRRETSLSVPAAAEAQHIP